MVTFFFSAKSMPGIHLRIFMHALIHVVRRSLTAVKFFYFFMNSCFISNIIKHHLELFGSYNVEDKSFKTYNIHYILGNNI